MCIYFSNQPPLDGGAATGDGADAGAGGGAESEIGRPRETEQR